MADRFDPALWYQKPSQSNPILPKGMTREQAELHMAEPPYAYLAPNRYFRFFLFKEESGETSVWLPDGFLV